MLSVDSDLHALEIGGNLGGDSLHLVREAATVGVTEHHAVGTFCGCGLQNSQGELGIGLVAVEEMLGVKEYLRKPFALDRMLKAVRQSLTESGFTLPEADAIAVPNPDEEELI